MAWSTYNFKTVMVIEKCGGGDEGEATEANISR